MISVPVIDLQSDDVAGQVASAAEWFGFFQVVGHGIDEQLINDVWTQTRAFFAQTSDAKRSILRTKENSRGYYDRELTKQARDLKEVLDIAHVPFPNFPDDDPRNFHRVDGVNQWPDLPGFRPTIMAWLAANERLSLQLLAAFAIALNEVPEVLQRHFGDDHTSFLRMNHYPLSDLLTSEEAADVTPLGDMALHHHSDAGGLTVLMQDDIGGLQVAHGDTWIDVEPVPGAMVINTGDIMQVWSNDRFTAALHRVAARSSHARFSLPYFFNPSYRCDYAPLPGSITTGDSPHYSPINWGDFRQGRADGDFADYGTEIQIDQFKLT